MLGRHLETEEKHGETTARPPAGGAPERGPLLFISSTLVSRSSPLVQTQRLGSKLVCLDRTHMQTHPPSSHTFSKHTFVSKTEELTVTCH